ncbi:DUF6913 domain-containing protein [Sunxiuqinia sp. sy24]|uniref:DUF6913 domain-containing protein n=1 Tax=Sunxiuqinia sp. sy24 TaxID=3461495 RepID=UPI004045942A
MSIKDQFITWLLKRKHKQLKRTVQFFNLNQVKTAGILWKSDDHQVFNQLKKQLKDSGILVSSLCFSNQAGSVGGEAIFSPDDFSMFGKIKNPEIVKFINQKFDLLLDISLSSGIELQYLRSLSKARFKAGWTEEQPNYFDLSIDVSHRQEPAYLAEQLVFYLSELNKQSLVNQKV